MTPLPAHGRQGSERLMRRGFQGTLLSWAVVLLAGCSSFTQLNLNDDSTPQVSARAVHRFGTGPGGGGIEVEVASVRATGHQQLDNFQLATLGNQSISGPASLTHTARVQHAQLVYNHLLFAGRPVELEWFAGAAWVHMSWTTASAAPGDPRLTQRSDWKGPAGGVLGRARLGPSLALELRYSAAADLSNWSSSRNSTELALAFRPAPALVLRLGLGETRTYARPDAAESELTVRTRGPFLSLGLEL
jgi:hypothetical protein